MLNSESVGKRWVPFWITVRHPEAQAVNQNLPFSPQFTGDNSDSDEAFGSENANALITAKVRLKTFFSL